MISFDNLNCGHRDKIRVNEDNQEIHKDVIIAVSSDPDLKVDVSKYMSTWIVDINLISQMFHLFSFVMSIPW